MQSDIVAHRRDLRGAHLSRGLVKVLYAQRVLHRHRRYRAERVYAKQCAGADVGLNTRAPTGVRSGDRQHPQWRRTRRRQRKETHWASGRYPRLPCSANSTAFPAMAAAMASSLSSPCLAAYSRTSWVIRIEQNFGPHIEQKWAVLAGSAGSVSS